MHIGHAKHFQQIKKNYPNSLLFVSITADKFVIKSTNRPYFNQKLRMQMLAALECVDYVTCIEDYSAVPAINSIKPDFYFKGKDFKNNKDDFTKKIYAEKKAVQKYKGQIKFTDDISFSSSNIINTQFSSLDEGAKNFLKKIKKDYNFKKIREIIENFKKPKILFNR